MTVFSQINELVSLPLDLELKKTMDAIETNTVIPGSFLKRVFLKDEISLLVYFTQIENSFIFCICIQEYDHTNKWINNLIHEGSYYDISDGLFHYCMDMIRMRENRVIILSQQLHGRMIIINIIDFFDNYTKYVKCTFYIKLINQMMHVNSRYSLIFKYKDTLGLQFENMNGESGFIIFGYFNSTDPKQINNIKKDGLEYSIELNNYLFLQSNIFGYEIRGIKIITVPETDSGLYFISNNTKNVVKANDILDYNTKIYLFFSKDILLKGKYIFKFAGVLEEANYDKYAEYKDDIYFNGENYYEEPTDEQLEMYKDFYNENRNLNIIGKASLVQINILENIKVFCDKENDNFCLKSNNGKCITCGKGRFYDVENANEVTQSLIGENYYFDDDKNVFIKCHKRCRRCSHEYNIINMQCDECLNSTYFFLRDNNCLEKSECEKNFYYDSNFDLFCLNKSIYCPDFKPFELKSTKECIEKCDFEELNEKCDPTNNIKSINITHNLLLENIKLLNLEQRLINDKEKIIIEGDNVTFIFTTPEIEEKELYEHINSTTVLLKECESILKSKNSINNDIPLIILKIETLDNHSDYLNLNFEILNPLNFSQKLDLNECERSSIEVRLPIKMKGYHSDLIEYSKGKGYNIFDSNDRFFHDICSVFIYNNSDISLSERKALIDLSNETFCIENCNFRSIDVYTMRSICDCNVKNNNESLIRDNNSNSNISDDLYSYLKTTIDFSKATNIRVIKCVSIIFNVNTLKKNYGFYLMLFTNIFNIILFIVSSTGTIDKSLNYFSNKVLSQIKEVYKDENIEESKDKEKTDDKNENEGEKKNENEGEKKNENEGEKKNENEGEKKNENEGEKNDENKNNKSKNILKLNSKRKNMNNNEANAIENNPDLSSRPIVITQQTDKIQDEKGNNNEIIKDNLNIKITEEVKEPKEDEYEKKIKELKSKNDNQYYLAMLIKNIDFDKRKNYLSDNELNDLPYIFALKIDNRQKGEYYWSLLKEKNKVISIFLNNEDYNISTIKISLFILTFNLSFTVNALFFNDEAIYQINQEQGSYNLNNQISRVVYSAIISTVIIFIGEYFALTSGNIFKLRNIKTFKEAEEFSKSDIGKIKFKSFLFFCIALALNLLFLYYITAFCAVYSIIQTIMISDSLISFLLSISYTLLLTLIPPIIRNISLKKNSKFMKLLYILSWLIAFV